MGMPNKKPVQVPASDLDYDLAMVTDPLTDDALDVLDTVYDARCNIDEFIALLDLAKRRIEQGAAPFDVREQVATDLRDIAAIFTRTARELGGIYATDSVETPTAPGIDYAA